MIARAAGLSPIKLNVVVLKENEADISDLIDFCRKKGLILQLIELLDLQHLGISGDIDAIERVGLCPIHRKSFCTAFTQQTLF